MKTKIIQTSRDFRLERRKKRYSKTPFYRIILHRGWHIDTDAIRAIEKMAGVRTQIYADNTGFYWDFRIKERADQMYMLILLKWT